MSDIYIKKLDNVHIQVMGEYHIIIEMRDHFTFTVPNHKYMSSYKMGQWDGKIRLMNMNGIIYLGLIAKIVKFCNSNGYTFNLDPNLIPNNQISTDIAADLAKKYNCKMSPRDYQAEAIRIALSEERRLFLSPTASGKSFIIYLISRYFVDEQDSRVLIIVPNLTLINQMSSDFVEYNNNQNMNIHLIKSGSAKTSSSPYTIGTWQSISKMPKDWFEDFDVIIGDEAHLFQAKSLKKIMENTRSIQYKFGFTGTLDDSLTNKLVLQGLFGPVKKVETTKNLIDKGTLSQFSIKAITLDYSKTERKQLKGASYQDEIKWISTNEERNKFIAKLANSLSGNVLIMFRFIEDQGVPLKDLLKNLPKQLHYMDGSTSGENRELIRKIVDNSDENIILASDGVFSTGSNVKRLDHLIFASPYKSKIKNLQSIGRVLRKSEHSNKATLYDLIDDLSIGSHENYALSHFKERVEIYSQEGFDISYHNYPIKEST